MRRILDTRGSAPLWAAFFAFVLCILSIAAYTAATQFSVYRSAQVELERAVNVAVDKNMENRNVRDLLLDIPEAPTISELQSRLAEAGWAEAPDGTWRKRVNGKLICGMKGFSVIVQGRWLELSCILVIPLPWATEDLTEVEMPLAVRSTVLYLD